MKKNEILAAIHQMKEQLAVLESLVLAESANEVKPQITEDGRELLPDPPKVIYVDLPKEAKVEAPDEDTVLGCKIITSLPDFYSGKCSVLKIHKRYFDNGQPKLFIDKYHVVITACDSDMKVIGEIVTHWNNLSKFHAELLKKGINTHSKDNWMPKTLLFDLD